MLMYYYDQCPFCRSTRLVARALGLKMEEKHVDLGKAEHQTPEFGKINPTRCLPTLIDGDQSMWESRPLMMYLADKYGAADGGTLYPKDPLKRFKINQMIFFEAGTLTSRYIQCYMPVLKQGASVDQQKKQLVVDALKTVDDILSKSKWIAGNDMTIADCALIPFITTIEAVKVDLGPFDNVRRWMADCKKSMTGYEEVNEYGLKQMKDKLISTIPALN